MALHITTQRLTPTDSALAGRLFALMARVFEEPASPLSEAYVAELLARVDFWTLAAFVDGTLAGGLTAHTLPMTRAEDREVFIYDLAVLETYQRQGVGRALVRALRDGARACGSSTVFVPADNEDVEALDFYRAVGGVASPVTFFTFDTA